MTSRPPLILVETKEHGTCPLPTTRAEKDGLPTSLRGSLFSSACVNGWRTSVAFSGKERRKRPCRRRREGPTWEPNRNSKDHNLHVMGQMASGGEGRRASACRANKTSYCRKAENGGMDEYDSYAHEQGDLNRSLRGSHTPRDFRCTHFRIRGYVLVVKADEYQHLIQHRGEVTQSLSQNQSLSRCYAAEMVIR
ncbi:hypothetical protein LX32DRAFT_443241 [Colletotrichum zoysiae]|uniref:Uncharacterized protein n=1 Tax=Colletotrichum zoysiae TaxID=1216348 RepID=A0AAD9HS53_9PEZI|nr:hypothetical protein LX32DRAFT_443241 [Colletotrichum zoysiae]